MCIPSQISQPSLSVNDRTKILLRALGALRTLRSHRRIVADEAAYRALIVACARCGTDRRVELMKLYGLLRSDGIFPNAVTLGQYTRAIAEGYSAGSAGTDGSAKVGMQLVISSDKGRSSNIITYIPSTWHRRNRSPTRSLCPCTVCFRWGPSRRRPALPV